MGVPVLTQLLYLVKRLRVIVGWMNFRNGFASNSSPVRQTVFKHMVNSLGNHRSKM